MTFPYSLKFFVKFGQVIGFLSRYEFKKKWQNQLMRIYCFVFNLIAVTALISHLLSTATRSIRYLPEFCQRLFEDLAFYLFWGECVFYKVTLNRFDKLMNFMHQHFSTANMQIVQSSHARAMFFLRLVFILTVASLSFSIIETYFPVSDEETELLRYIYKRARPERRLQTNFWIPFLDDSESPTYEIMFYLEFYLIFLIAVSSTVSFAAIPMLVTYMEGQYEILYLHVKMIGSVHRDHYGDVIYYTNFETGSTFKLNPRSDWKINQVVYDRYYCHQVIKFHRKLLRFQDKVSL
uniref:Odorant receptor n=1 Tax=Cacopsylla melanoneura TaxID=428564 RepID=A0A8D9AD41_9HEMI